jgi:lipoate---protein ligase
MTHLHLIELHAVPIYDQLRLEEALLRTDTRNVCIINRGAPRAIVLGLSGDPDELLHREQVERANVPLLRRLSGGGCVVVDEETLFVSFLFNKGDLSVTPFPEPILRWANDFYQHAWGVKGFSLWEHDFVIGDTKCGGNAQYIQKDRWLLHTSFLYDFRQSNMDLLRLPKKRPAYRADRSHAEFLCRLKNHASLDVLITGIKKELANRFTVLPCFEKEYSSVLHREYRKSTTKIH